MEYETGRNMKIVYKDYVLDLLEQWRNNRTRSDELHQKLAEKDLEITQLTAALRQREGEGKPTQDVLDIHLPYKRSRGDTSTDEETSKPTEAPTIFYDSDSSVENEF